MRRVVVTGIGLLTSIGNNCKTSWDNLLNSKSGIKKIDHFDVADLPSKIAGFIDNDPDSINYFNKSSILFCIEFTLSATDKPPNNNSVSNFSSS